MSLQLSVPVAITPQAAARVAELGFENIVERVLENTARLVPRLVSMRLRLDSSYDADDIDWLMIECRCTGQTGYPHDREARLAWNDWRVDNLPMEIGRHFFLEIVGIENGHAGQAVSRPCT